MSPKPLRDMRDYIESTQATIQDPSERDRALAVVERDLRDLMGLVQTYRHAAQQQGEDAAGQT